MFAVDEAAIFQVAQGQSNRDPAQIESPAKLMLARDREGRLLVGA